MLHPMAYSVWTEYFYCQEMTLKEKVQAFQSCGYTVSELSDEDGRRLLDETGDCGTAAGKKIRAVMEETGYDFPQGHLWLSANVTGDDYKEKFEQLKPWFDMYLEAGILRGVLHCHSQGRTVNSFGNIVPQCYEEAQKRRAEVLGKVKDYLKGTDLTICVENIPRSDTAESEGLLKLMKELDSPNFGICLDTGHLNLAGESQEHFILNCGSYLKALHLADNMGGFDEHLMPGGHGTVDFVSVVAALRKIGYDGIFNYEIPGENHCSIEMRLEKLHYLRRISDLLTK